MLRFASPRRVYFKTFLISREETKQYKKYKKKNTMTECRDKIKTLIATTFFQSRKTSTVQSKQTKQMQSYKNVFPGKY